MDTAQFPDEAIVKVKGADQGQTSPCYQSHCWHDDDDTRSCGTCTGSGISTPVAEEAEVLEEDDVAVVSIVSLVGSEVHPSVDYDPG